MSAAGRAALFISALLLTTAAPAQAQRTLYVTANSPAAGLYTLTINTTTGALTEVPASMVAAGTTPAVPGVSPDGGLLFAPDYWGSQLYGFSLNPATGAPTALGGSPTATVGNSNAAVFKPDGSALHVADYSNGSISSSAVSPSGVLTADAGSPYSVAGAPTTVAVSPATDQLYAPGYTGDAINGFAAGSAGALSVLSGFPLAVAGANPIDAEYSPDGENLFVLNQLTSDIVSYAVNQTTGALTTVGSPVAVGGTASGLAATPDGKWLAAINQSSDELAMFAISGSGTLSAAGSPVAVGGGAPTDIVITPDSRFAYVTNYNSGTISGFAINGSTGAATPIPGSPFTFFAGPAFSMAISPDQGPTAALVTSVSGATASFDASGSSDPDGSVASYSWAFGDGDVAVTTSPTTTHSYAANGNYTTSLTVTDNEGCSTTRIGTGQTINCNGSAAAATAAAVAIDMPAPAPPPAPTPGPAPEPILFTKVSVQQLRLQRGQTRRRVLVRYSLNRPPRVTMQFQRVTSGRMVGGRCRYKTAANGGNRRCLHVRNYGSTVSVRGNSGANRKTFVRTLGGRPMKRGRYRLKIWAVDSAGTRSKTYVRGFRVQAR